MGMQKSWEKYNKEYEVGDYLKKQMMKNIEHAYKAGYDNGEKAGVRKASRKKISG